MAFGVNPSIFSSTQSTASSSSSASTPTDASNTDTTQKQDDRTWYDESYRRSLADQVSRNETAKTQMTNTLNQVKAKIQENKNAVFSLLNTTLNPTDLRRLLEERQGLRSQEYVLDANIMSALQNIQGAQLSAAKYLMTPLDTVA